MMEQIQMLTPMEVVWRKVLAAVLLVVIGPVVPVVVIVPVVPVAVIVPVVMAVLVVKVEPMSPVMNATQEVSHVFY